MRRAWFFRSRLTLSSVVVGAFFTAAACGNGGDLKPLPGTPEDAGADADADATALDASPDAADAGVLGKPCAEDGECDDAIACTADTCDPTEGRCRNVAKDGACDNGVFCDGVEVCDVHLGCQAGPPMACTTTDPCTISACVEATHTCTHVPRDVDGDGDPDAHCGGGDCNDTDPTVSSMHPEICANGVDDNCDGQIDEMPCVQPANDTCFDALMLPGPGVFTMSTAGAKLDYGASCGPAQVATSRDVVALLVVPPGPDQRLDVKVTVPQGTVAVELSTACGVSQTELACAKSQASSKGGQVAHARAWDVAPGQAWITIYTDADTSAVVNVALSDAGSPPANETCGTAELLLPETPVTVPLVGAAADVPSACAAVGPDLVYRVDLDAPHDVRAITSTVDGLGRAIVSLRHDPCGTLPGELTCATGDPVTAFARNVAAGPLYVAVKATVATDVSLLVTLSPPTTAPADETCATAPPLVPDVDQPIDLSDHTDDVSVCATGLVDAAYALTLAQPSDVLSFLRVSSGDYGALSLERSPCAAKSDVLSCQVQGYAPIRVRAHGLDAGDYRVVPELGNAQPATLTTLVRPALATTFVPFAGTCDTAVDIPASGGSFQGNTQNASAKYSAGCDQGGVGPFGAPEQMLRLTLTEKRRVVFDMEGSNYPTLLDVRKGPSCPGDELPQSCTIGTGAGTGRSFLDLTLEPGTYFVQVDGFAGASGEWQLDVFVVAP